MATKKLCLTLLSLIAGLCLVCFPFGAEAGEPTDQIKGTVEAVMKILGDKELARPEKEKERRARIRQTIAMRFDFEEMAKRSLSIHWKERTTGEQKEFVDLYADLLENTYIRKVERYENEQVDYHYERSDGNYAVVMTRVFNNKGLSIPVDYRMFREKQLWKVYDVIIEGISLVNNYRTQFTQIIRSDSYNELVRRLREKANK